MSCENLGSTLNILDFQEVINNIYKKLFYLITSSF